jgi:hypothetical protein
VKIWRSKVKITLLEGLEKSFPEREREREREK